MNSITKFENAVVNYTEISRKLALLAYLQYHYDNPCLHPDDVYTAGGGYEGIGPVIVYLASSQEMPDGLRYPTSLLKLDHVVSNIEEDDDTIDALNFITDFLNTFAEEDIDEMIDSLKCLLSYDSEETLADLISILEYIKKG